MKKHVFNFNFIKIQGMKGMKIWLAGLMMLMAVGVWGQGWLKTYGGPEKEGGSISIFSPEIASAPTTDGGVLVAASTNPPLLGPHPIYLIKTNANGDILTEKFISDPNGKLVPNDMKLLPDGGYIICGKWTFNALRTPFLVRLDANLEVLWLRTYNFNVLISMAGDAVIQAPDGGFTITGNYTQYPEGSQHIFLIKTDVEGNQLWESSFPVQNFYDFSADGLAITSENGYLIASSSENPLSGFLFKIDSIGQLVWQHNFSDSNCSYTTAFCVALSPNGEYVVGGSICPVDVWGFTVPLCAKLTSDGVTIWSKTWDNFPDFSYFHNLIPMPEGGYLLLGTALIDNNQEVLIVRIDEDGNELWLKTIGTNEEEAGVDLFQLQNGALIISGTAYRVSTKNDILLLKTDANGNLYTSALTGTVHQDPELDCLPDPTENGLAGWLVQATGAQSFATLTDSLGQFVLPVDTGNYEVTVAPPGPYWEVCNSPTAVSITSFYDTLSLDFPAQAIADCPYLTVDISAPFLRRCFDNNYSVHYCNEGTVIAEDATVEVTLDPYFTYVSSTLSPASQNGNVLVFDVGDVAVNECGSFFITALLDCDSTVLGQTHCTSAHISPDSLCLPPDPLWDGSSIEVDVSCDGDSVTFTITNVGANGMPAPLGYIIIEDQIVLMTDEFQLPSGGSTTITVPANGSTFHLEAQQATGHPSGFASTGATIEGCGGWFSLGLFTQWAFDDDPDPFTDVDCQANVGSYDPNDKQGFPNGFGEEHLIEPGQDLEYLIRFQNTGTDTAFKVTIVDILPPELDLATVRPGASSYPYTYGVTPEGWLTFTFDDIMLPDSNVNEAASHGFVRFRASQVPGLGQGNVIANMALIYFDFNAPIQTNIYMHRIGQVNPWTLVGTKPPVFNPKKQVRIVPNPLTDSALLKVEGIEPGPLRLVLTDVSGKVLRQQTVNDTGFEFQRSELNPGMYFFQIERNGERVGSGKLMVR